ncbi:nucleolar protein of 40 kDa [Orussus abietinus]|uniref:nucleolar protein of 40 kDa n=1 Tax=Orussus abietinus TaxID=222816 RepID=UPI0006250444|nr:nucleolar protein of 40 kDa [Orussus abietinus]
MGSVRLNQIFLGEVASVQNYGAFIRIPGCSQQGLVHKSQVSTTHVDDVADVLQRGDRVWCKVISMGDDGKIGLSMKHVNQGNGMDLDPNGVQLQRDEQKRKSIVPTQRKVIELQAVLNTTCTKCGTAGHLSKDCFMSPDGKKYELIPEVEEESPPIISTDRQSENVEKKHKQKKLKKRKKSKKSKVKDSSTDSDDESDQEDRKKKQKKKRSKEQKHKKKRRSSTSSDGETTGEVDNNDTKTHKRDRSKKCKHSRSKS